VTNQVVVMTKKASSPSRSSADIAADLDRTRTRLAGNVQELRDYFTPTAVARRGSERATGWFLDDFGGVRPDRVAKAAAPVVLAVLGFGLARRHRG
jgi:hypothetical protein